MAGSLSFLDVATTLSREAGASLLETFGGRWDVSHKADNSVVTEADARAERIITDGLRRHFPGHSIIGEESGCDLQSSDIVWVIDPLDGTSNYASGIPWFGVLIGVLQRGVPVAAVMYLPAAGDLYAAEAGAGAFRNGQRVTVTPETRLSDVLWAYGMDAGMTGDDVEGHVRIVTNLVRRTRNVRATNSLVDAAFTADGRLGGFLNQQLHLWDIVAPLLVVQEAGGVYTDLAGQPLRLDLSSSAATREYAGLAGAPQLHREVVEIVAQVDNRERRVGPNE
jgi:myo-inositol-1(or 4)-monophosphatase